jgi:hypothetical protein
VRIFGQSSHHEERVDEQVDVEIARRQGAGDGVDQERHVVRDDLQRCAAGHTEPEPELQLPRHPLAGELQVRPRGRDHVRHLAAGQLLVGDETPVVGNQFWVDVLRCGQDHRLGDEMLSVGHWLG